MNNLPINPAASLPIGFLALVLGLKLNRIRALCQDGQPPRHRSAKRLDEIHSHVGRIGDLLGVVVMTALATPDRTTVRCCHWRWRQK